MALSRLWVGVCAVLSCPKIAESYFEYHHYLETPETARLSILDRCLHRTQPITLRTAEYVIRTLGGVRGALRSVWGGAVYSIIRRFLSSYLIVRVISAV